MVGNPETYDRGDVSHWVALARVEEGRTSAEIADELATRITLGSMATKIMRARDGIDLMTSELSHFVERMPSSMALKPR